LKDRVAKAAGHRYPLLRDLPAALDQRRQVLRDRPRLFGDVRCDHRDDQGDGGEQANGDRRDGERSAHPAHQAFDHRLERIRHDDCRDEQRQRTRKHPGQPEQRQRRRQ
jgi:hypothetical protein